MIAGSSRQDHTYGLLTNNSKGSNVSSLQQKQERLVRRMDLQQQYEPLCGSRVHPLRCMNSLFTVHSSIVTNVSGGDGAPWVQPSLVVSPGGTKIAVLRNNILYTIC